MSVTREHQGPRQRLRAILAGGQDDELARAFATYRAEVAELLGDPAATTLSKRGHSALARVSQRTLATWSAVRKVEPRVHEADVLLKALEGYHRGLHDLRVAHLAPISAESAARVQRAAQLILRSGKAVERSCKELHG